jgi:hypothetical protein
LTEEREVRDFGFGNPEIKEVRVSRLEIDPTVQRKLDKNRVDKMIAKMNLEAIGVLTTNLREQGGLFVVDGQHRCTALKLGGWPDHIVTTNQYTGLSLAAEAVLFELLNTTKQPMPIDFFRARLLSGDPATTHMWQILTERNWRITMESGDNRFAAVRSLENLYRLSGVVAERTVDILTRAWNGADSSLDYRLLSGLGHVLLRYGDLVNDERMVKKLHEYSGGPAGLIGTANTFRATMKNKAKDAMAFTIVGAYNHNARENNQLPQWGASL